MGVLWDKCSQEKAFKTILDSFCGLAYKEISRPICNIPRKRSLLVKLYLLVSLLVLNNLAYRDSCCVGNLALIAQILSKEWCDFVFFKSFAGFTFDFLISSCS